MSVTASSFAEALRDAIDRRGLGLERIRDHLQHRGVTISVATLSYWQSGRSRPERKSSLAALPHLESVLDLPPGTLHAALQLPAPRRRRAPVAGLDAVWPETPQAWVLGRLDTRWDAELDRICVQDRLVLGPDRRQRSLTVRQVMRARTDGPDRRVVLHCHDDPTASTPVIRALRGCTVGRTARHPGGGVVGAELVFWHPLQRGETVVTEYEVVAAGVGPREEGYSRRFRLPVVDYLLEVEFDAAALPARCRSLAAPGDGTPLVLDPANCVHVVDTDCRGGTAGVSWTWDAGPDGS